MHYLVDIPVGFAIAALVIVISDPSVRIGTGVHRTIAVMRGLARLKLTLARPA
jgi:hypothetical protein